VKAREQDVLRALPASDETPLKWQTELEARLARTVSGGGWSQPTISRTVNDLKRRGLIEEARLKRTRKGDSEAK
jgi:hypothetical protein